MARERLHFTSRPFASGERDARHRSCRRGVPGSVRRGARIAHVVAHSAAQVRPAHERCDGRSCGHEWARSLRVRLRPRCVWVQHPGYPGRGLPDDVRMRGSVATPDSASTRCAFAPSAPRARAGVLARRVRQVELGARARSSMKSRSRPAPLTSAYREPKHSVIPPCTLRGRDR